MKTGVSSRRHRDIRRLGILLATIALVVGIVSCDGGASCGCGGPTGWYLGTSSGEGGQVIVSGGPTFADGTVVTIEAVPDECYEFVNWTGANVSDPYSAITTITMDQAQNLTANFALLSYDLMVGSTDGGQVTSPGEDTFVYDCGTVVALVAAAEEGYFFGNWSGDVGIIANINSPTTTITIEGDCSVTANFGLIPPEQFVLTTSSTTGGLVSTPGEGTFLYDEDTVVNLVAEAEECYQFVNWTGATVADPNSATTTVTMDGDKNVTANFALLRYDLTVGSTDGGQVTSPGEDTFTYDCGTLVDLVAAADEGYYFVNWTGDVSTVDNVESPVTIIAMQDSYAISANFEQIPPEQFTLAISSTVGGSVAAPGEGVFTYDEGATVNLAAEADEGYQFANWTGDVGTIADVYAASTTIAMSDSYSISANFEEVAVGQIWNWYDLDAIRDNLGGSYVLMNDLDSATAGYTVLASETAAGGKGWQPIGTTAENDRFVGRFNGQGHVICDLVIDRFDESRVGLFGVVGEGGVIESIGVVNGSVTGHEDVGGLVGKNEAAVDNSYSTCRVIGNNNVGGLVGHNSGNVSNCYCTGRVTGGSSVGGLVGHNSGNVSDSYCTGIVTGALGVGGLVGENQGTASNCFSSGSVTGNNYVGGLEGQNEGTARNCSSAGSVTGNNYVGGLVGMNEGTVSDSYSTGSATGNTRVGGLVGQNSNAVSKSYSTGRVTGNKYVGGLVGRNSGTVSNAFWDTQTSGQPTSSGGTGKTTAQMKDITTFSGAGWNMVAVANSGTRNTDYIWNIVDDVTHPFMSWQL